MVPTAPPPESCYTTFPYPTSLRPPPPPPPVVAHLPQVLVPTDAAFDAALAKYPAAMTDPALLQQILKFHLLPPEPRTK